MLGVATGAGAFTLVYADGAAYLRDDPIACANCHVMREQFAAWERGSHRTAAVCNCILRLFEVIRLGSFHSGIETEREGG